jgi:aryl-alcohol dehydrogenase-like predicted oxidoreductase
MMRSYTQNPVAETRQIRHGFSMSRIPHINLPGVSKPVSQLILGCDNKDTWEEGAPVWDHWLEAGGNAFDTGYVYGGGKQEKALGDWMARRGVAKDVVVTVKGAHTPHCDPDSIGRQLAISLERLQLDFAPIYIMHRDNPEVPVGEFVEALNALKAAGRIGVFGGSNWSIERFTAAKSYADAKGLEPLTILNNNLSLAVMEKPVWDGCITSNTPATLEFLRNTHTCHFSWSSQARGYFLPVDLRNRLPEDTRPETCFGSKANATRRLRAETLALQHGVSAHNIATAWVLNQSFPSFALVGARTADEIDSTLPGCGLALPEADVRWLNLEA